MFASASSALNTGHFQWQFNQCVPRRTLTQQVVCSKSLPIKYLSVIGTAQVLNNVVRLDRYCGELWGIPDPDSKTYTKAQEAMEQLEEEIKSLKLEVRAGSSKRRKRHDHAG